MEKKIIYQDYDLMSSTERDKYCQEIAIDAGIHLEDVDAEWVCWEKQKEFEAEFDKECGWGKDITHGKPVIVTGTLNLWDGPEVVKPKVFKDLPSAVERCLEESNLIYEDEDGDLHIEAHHHDGVNHFLLQVYEDEKNWTPIHYMNGGRTIIIDYKRCMAVTGFNSKQVWIYDNEHDVYIDPPKAVLDEIDEKTDHWDFEAKESLMEDVIATNPAWLQDGAHMYDGETTDI